jgi:exopolysaccharide production protein ExoQ
MYDALYAVLICVWFAVIYLALGRRGNVYIREGSFWVPTILLVAFFMVPWVFQVSRTRGTAVLEEGLTLSNILSVAIVAVSALYLVVLVVRNIELLRLPTDKILFPFCLAIGFAFLSSAWSVAPLYTLYRTTELLVLFTISLLIFDRERFGPAFVTFNAVMIGVWLLVDGARIADNVANGIIFSSGKHNLTPLMCMSVLSYLYAFHCDARYKWPLGVLCVVGFIVGGSAAAVGATPLLVTGVMAASPRPWVRRLGWVASATYLALFIFLLVGLSQYPDLMEFIGTVLQKPVAELAENNGRSEFWPIFIEAARDRPFGGGFAAAERFIQLVNYDAVLRILGPNDVFIASAHNMAIGAWVGMGWVGICILITTLGHALLAASRLDVSARRFVYPVVLMVIANGMTTPGILGEFNPHTITWVALLAFLRTRDRLVNAQSNRASTLLVRFPRDTRLGPVDLTARRPVGNQ